MNYQKRMGEMYKKEEDKRKKTESGMYKKASKATKKYNNMNRGGNFYKFNPGDPDNLTFEVGSGDLVYIGAYEVGRGEKSGTFSFAPTEYCGDEEKAITEYDAHAMDHLLFRNTVWPERFDEKMKDL